MFSAVVTTGIYCRPGCGARPLAENVRRFASAAGAEAAGYRACHRCRPYRDAPAPPTAPELVCRAVQLILDGALDRESEAGLGRRLGVSARHLRRLFTTHLGVTPNGLARSARAHFARRLLDDTDLSVTEIAFASGFGSLRQFNRAAQEVFRGSPRELRARRRAGDPLAADGGLMLRLPYRGPLDWSAVAGALAVHAIPGVERVSRGTYRRTVVIDGDPGVLELAPGDGHLLLRAHLPHWEGLIHVVQRARRIASLDLDMDEAHRQLASDPIAARLLRARPGVRPAGTWDRFETGVCTMLEEGSRPEAVAAIAHALVVRCGTRVDGLAPLGLSHTFPSAAALARADLDGLGLTPVQRRAIGLFAAGVAADQIRLDGSASLDNLVASLTAVTGISELTAQRLALRLGERDAWPGDARLAEALRRCSGGATDLPDRWRPWRAVAAATLLADDPDRLADPSRLARRAQARTRPDLRSLRAGGRPAKVSAGDSGSRDPGARV